jgi:hypothetical protein
VDSFESTDEIRTAVVTGQHPFDVPSFHSLFASLPGVAPFIQNMEDWACDAGGVRQQYDVAIFYNMHIATPTGEGSWCEAPVKPAIEGLGSPTQGILVLHHAVLAFPEWPLWTEVTGLPGRGRFTYDIGETLTVDLADTSHPITEGLSSWTMVDEVYGTEEPSSDCHILLTTNHPKSMKAIAWTREHHGSRIFCLQSGHDNATWANPVFRIILARGIAWCARTI